MDTAEEEDDDELFKDISKGRVQNGNKSLFDDDDDDEDEGAGEEGEEVDGKAANRNHHLGESLKDHGEVIIYSEDLDNVWS